MKAYPVIHINSLRQTVEQADIAFQAAADGVFLIDHRSEDPYFLPTAFNSVAKQHPAKFVGLNFLQYSGAYDPYQATYALHKYGALRRLPNAIWTDDVLGRLDDEDPAVATVSELQDFQALRRAVPVLKRIKLYGGTAFKYTAHYSEDAVESARQATTNRKLVDVVTTSGEGTSQAPSVDKIRAMKLALGKRPLAVASGISIENIIDYRGLVDMVLFASSVETKSYSGIFDEAKLAEFITAAHQL